MQNYREEIRQFRSMFIFGMGGAFACLVYLGELWEYWQIGPMKYGPVTAALGFLFAIFLMGMSWEYVLRALRGQDIEFRVDENGMEGMARRLPLLTAVWRRITWDQVTTIYARPNTGFVSIRFSVARSIYTIVISNSAIPVDVKKAALEGLRRHRPDLHKELALAFENARSWTDKGR
ncbi:hypothetical protein [Phyllobacterium zundukense]|uniref:Uncharacterized protein n=1 Tax=Phyllobacterium zundukense TaxID=1867719 RepID=A0ACD4D357_9HYPH|nr:hypothetical protein [Phyllobacterium zundukense]UXN60296.1 hypothetical protein N8E88_27945 [Phyllobacterium zundukense]